MNKRDCSDYNDGGGRLEGRGLRDPWEHNFSEYDPVRKSWCPGRNSRPRVESPTFLERKRSVRTYGHTDICKNTHLFRRTKDSLCIKG